MLRSRMSLKMFFPAKLLLTIPTSQLMRNHHGVSSKPANCAVGQGTVDTEWETIVGSSAARQDILRLSLAPVESIGEEEVGPTLCFAGLREIIIIM